MKTIIAGSRTITDYAVVVEAIAASGFVITEVVSGHASMHKDADGVWRPSVDRLGEHWAKEHGVPARLFPADWLRFGKAAGFRRNTEMGDYAEALIAVTTGSPGTRHMIGYARTKGLKVFVWDVRPGAARPAQAATLFPEPR